jgi:molecular chaperone GrpE
MRRRNRNATDFGVAPERLDESGTDAVPDASGTVSPVAAVEDQPPASAVSNDVATEPVAEDLAQRLEDELAEQRDKYLRLAAEYDNYRRRMIRERSEASTRGQAELVRQMTDALDDLARFAHLDPSATDAATVVEGVDLVERKLHKVLGAAGLEIVNPVNEQFDPALHEAIATEPAESAELDHTVSRVSQPGYVFNGQLLRPARVIVRQWTG